MEKSLRVVVGGVGDDNIVVSTGDPDSDGPCSRGVYGFSGLDKGAAESKRKILWDNRLHLYGFGEATPLGF